MPARIWIRGLLLIWFVVFFFILLLPETNPPTWIARDAIIRGGPFIDLAASVPVRDGELIRMATTAPGIVSPTAAEAKDRRVSLRVPIPDNASSHGLHLWSALPDNGEAPRKISNGTLAILDPEARWIAVDLDEGVANLPWDSLGTDQPPIPNSGALDGLLLLSQHAVIVGSTRLPESRLPLFRKWWDLHSFPVSVIIPESDLPMISERLTARLGPPAFYLSAERSDSNREDSFRFSTPHITCKPEHWPGLKTRFEPDATLEEKENR